MKIYVVLTVGNMWYGEPLYTFPSHEEAWKWAHTEHFGWFNIEEICA